MYLIHQEPCHEDVEGSGGIAPLFLTSALDGGEWTASRPDLFIAGERALGTHLTGGWVGFWAGLEAVETSLLTRLGI
jgi:hypothetical protein